MTAVTNINGKVGEADSFVTLKTGTPGNRCDGHFGSDFDRKQEDSSRGLSTAAGLPLRSLVKPLGHEPKAGGTSEGVPGNDLLIARDFELTGTTTMAEMYNYGGGDCKNLSVDHAGNKVAAIASRPRA